MKYIIYLLLGLPMLLQAQQNVNGVVVTSTPEGNAPLYGVNVYWQNTTIGVATNEKGEFSLPMSEVTNQLVFSYIGFKTQIITVTSDENIQVELIPSDDTELEEVVVAQKKDASQRLTFDTKNVTTINSSELLKAACCNLSESFETNPSIDVNFSDAVTGTKQIQMLGLTSPYLLITEENIPSVRGASQAYGLTFTPGTWVESIQVTKGAGSVINGYESISGQINTELVKPMSDSKLFVNAYANQNGRYELNTHLNTQVSKKWSTGLYVHGNMRKQKEDGNDDGFLDAPLGQQINVMNRWQYTDNEKGWVSFFNIRYLNDDKQTGQLDFDPNRDKLTTNFWGSEIKTNRFDVSNKTGYVFPDAPWRTIGLQNAFSYHHQDSYYGLNTYDIKHQSYYSNLLFNSIISDTRHKIKTGINFTYDKYEEAVNTNNYQRIDNSVGAFGEYAFDDLNKFSMTAGLRIDNHNRLGFFVTPRLHARYFIWENGTLKASVGRGRRMANIFAENQQLFATSRTINIVDEGGSVYGLDPEDAWNYGVSFIQKFKLNNRKGDITFDFYRTDFNNQIVVDWENPDAISFYNLDGKSFANSFQVEVNYEVLKNLDLRTAYKYYDIQTDYTSGRLQKPLQPKHRIFGNLSYETPLTAKGSQWRFDYTYNWLGEQRLPNTNSNPEAFRLGATAKSYSLMNAQVTKVFSNTFEVYVGGENLTNYKQQNPIIDAENPFGSNFDSSIVYAPIMGRMFYAGLRFNLK